MYIKLSTEGPYSLYFWVYCGCTTLHSKLKCPVISDFGKTSDKMECDLESFEKHVAEYTEWFKSDQSKNLARRVYKVW